DRLAAGRALAERAVRGVGVGHAEPKVTLEVSDAEEEGTLGVGDDAGAQEQEVARADRIVGPADVALAADFGDAARGQIGGRDRDARRAAGERARPSRNGAVEERVSSRREVEERVLLAARRAYEAYAAGGQVE